MEPIRPGEPTVKRIPLADAPELAPLIERMREGVVVTTADGPVAVVLTPEEYRDLRTLADLAEDPARLADVVRAHRRFQAGEPQAVEDWRAVFE